MTTLPSATPLVRLERIGVHLASATLMTLLLAGCWATLVLPIQSSRREAITDEQRLSLIVDAGPQVTSRQLSIQQELDIELASLAQLQTSVPQSPTLDNVFKTLSDAARKTAVEIAFLQPAGIRSAPLAELQFVRMRVKCSYGNLCRFLSAIHDSPQYIWVHGIELSSERSADSGNVEVRHAEIWLALPHAAKLLESPPSDSRENSVAQQVR